MMFKLTLILLCLAAGLALGPHLAGNKGYVLIAFDHYTLEMSVTSAIFLNFLLFCSALLCLWLLRWCFSSVKRSSLWWGSRRKQQAAERTQQGMLAMLSGDYQHAEKLIAKAANHSEAPALNYLAAAEAAQEQGQSAKRDQYLAKASATSNKEPQVLMAQARLQLKQQDYKAALANLEALPQDHSKRPAAKAMLLQIYPALGMWQAQLELLPSCLKLSVISPEQERQLFTQAHQQLFHQQAQRQGADAVAAHWNKMPRKQKKQAEVIAAACRALIAAQDSTAAYQLLGDLLRPNSEALLFEVAAELQLNDPHPLVEQLKKLKKQNSSSPLLLALAQQQYAQRHYSEAQNNLEESLQLSASSHSHHLLGDVFTAQGKVEPAAKQYKQALNLLN